LGRGGLLGLQGVGALKILKKPAPEGGWVLSPGHRPP